MEQFVVVGASGLVAREVPAEAGWVCDCCYGASGAAKRPAERVYRSMSGSLACALCAECAGQALMEGTDESAALTYYLAVAAAG